jgi:hypothetical protein
MPSISMFAKLRLSQFKLGFLVGPLSTIEAK